MDNELKKVGQDLVNTLNRIVIEKKKEYFIDHKGELMTQVLERKVYDGLANSSYSPKEIGMMFGSETANKVTEIRRKYHIEHGAPIGNW